MFALRFCGGKIYGLLCFLITKYSMVFFSSLFCTLIHNLSPRLTYSCFALRFHDFIIFLSLEISFYELMLFHKKKKIICKYVYNIYLCIKYFFIINSFFFCVLFLRYSFVTHLNLRQTINLKLKLLSFHLLYGIHLIYFFLFSFIFLGIHLFGEG